MATQIARINALRNLSASPVNRIFGEFFARPWHFGEDLGLSATGPALDVLELGEEYQIKVDVPGFDREKINLRFENRTLTLSGERQLPEQQGERYHRVESFAGRFSRSLTLPVEIDVNAISAELTDGVLTVHLPKAESARPRNIDVRIA